MGAGDARHTYHAARFTAAQAEEAASWVGTCHAIPSGWARSGEITFQVANVPRGGSCSDGSGGDDNSGDGKKHSHAGVIAAVVGAAVVIGAIVYALSMWRRNNSDSGEYRPTKVPKGVRSGSDSKG